MATHAPNGDGYPLLSSTVSRPETLELKLVKTFYTDGDEASRKSPNVASSTSIKIRNTAPEPIKSDQQNVHNIFIPYNPSGIQMQDRTRSNPPRASTPSNFRSQNQSGDKVVNATKPTKHSSNAEHSSADDASSGCNWGWLVMFGGFFCLFACEGLIYSYGLFMFEMITGSVFSFESPNSTQVYNERSLSSLSLPGALFAGLGTLIGPLADALALNFSYRCVTGTGSLLAAMSIFASAFCQDFALFTFVFGVLGGIGCGLVYLPSITVVGPWFEEHRIIVIGLAFCGGGLGAGLICAMFHLFSDIHPWRNLLVLSSIMFLQSLVGIALFRSMFSHEIARLVEQQQRREAKEKHARDLLRKSKPISLFETNPHIKRGSIMSRIIAEKHRQRTISTGSLDGMVITRENKLVALPSPEARETVMNAVAAYVRSRQPAVGSNSGSPSHEGHPLDALVPGVLRTVQEDIPLELEANRSPRSLVILPPPVVFNEIAIHRIALLIIHKLEQAKLLPVTSSQILEAGHSVDSGRPDSCFTSEDQRWRSEHEHVTDESFEADRKKEDYLQLHPLQQHPDSCERTSLSDIHVSTEPVNSSAVEMANHLKPDSTECSPGDRYNSPSHHSSTVSLDSEIERFISTEVDILNVSLTTKLSIMNAIHTELSQPKYRSELHTKRRLKQYKDKESTSPSPRLQPFQPTNRIRFSSNSRETPRDQIDGSPNSVLVDNDTSVKELVGWQGVKQYAVDVLNPEPFRSRTFLVVIAASILISTALLVPYYYLPLLLKFGGIECSLNRLRCPGGLPVHALHDSQWLKSALVWSFKDDQSSLFFLTPGSVLATITFSHILGRLFISIYIDRKTTFSSKRFSWLRQIKNPVLFKSFALVLCAFAVCCYPLSIGGLIKTVPRATTFHLPGPHANQERYTQAWSLSSRVMTIYVASIVYGFASASVVSLRTLSLADVFGIIDLKSIVGYILFFQGLSMICGPPLFGLFGDSVCTEVLRFTGEQAANLVVGEVTSNIGLCVGRLNWMFYLCAAFHLVGALLYLPLQWLAERDNYCQKLRDRGGLNEISMFVGSDEGFIHQDEQTTQIVPR